MKNILILLLSLISTVAYPQYPIKTVYKSDSVVIMTTDQFEGLDLMLSNQKNKNASLENKIVQLNMKNDSLVSVIEKDSLVIDSLNVRLKTIQNWTMEASIDGAWMYYDWIDSTMKYMDLSMYAFYANRKSGKIILFRTAGSIKNPDINYWKSLNRQSAQVFEKNWNSFFKKKIQPTVSKFPYKVVTPYKPKEVIEIKLSE